MARSDEEKSIGRLATERSTEDLRQEIAREQEEISQTVGEIGERIEEKLNWRRYVEKSPYAAIGAAAAAGFVAMGMMTKRRKPVDQIVDAVSRSLRGSKAGKYAKRTAPKGLINMTLLGFATKAASGWLKNAAMRYADTAARRS